jgi:tetratricopeptide (TPR) repeat protein
MRLNHRSWAAFAIVSSCLVVSPVRAEGHHADTAVTGPARERYRAGAAAYDEGRYQDAIDAFLEANRIAPSAALSFDVARAYDKQRDTAKALEWYRDYLRRAPGAGDRIRIQRLVGTLQNRLVSKGVQQVTILSTPVGATVTLDGAPVGVTPWTGELKPGAHHLTLSRRGSADGNSDFVLAIAEARDVVVELEPEPTSSPPPIPEVTTAPDPAPSATERRSSHDASLPEGAASPRPASGSPFTTIGWIGVGVGAAALGAAAGFEIARRTAESDAKSDKQQVEFANDYDRMKSRQTIARVLAGAGAGVAVLGGVFLVVGSQSHSKERDTAFSFGCLPGVCSASASGRF